ncbi:MAG: 30S ribosomal protein S2 [Candidatus Obscuribacterales bacterium]|nr:30S ribosomal protein S2 [Candidatus Obscuribacterales bacterium]
MTQATMRQLLEAGVHFGHQTRRWNPKMRPYIFGERNGIYIIDLEQTSRALEKACDFIKKAASERKNIVFVGTKKQACDIVEEEAKRAGAHYVSRRWLGGMLTNFETIRLRINRLKELEDMRDTGEFYRRPKKEVAVLNRELTKLEKTLGGLKNMRGKPDILFIIDQKRELIAVTEAQKMGITTVGIIDTNCDPDGINYVIPGNDDSIRSIKLITGAIADAIIEGREGTGIGPIIEAEKVEVQETAPVPELVPVGGAAIHLDEKDQAIVDSIEDEMST